MKAAQADGVSAQAKVAAARAGIKRAEADGLGALPVFAGQTIRPIDLANALRLADAQSPDIATARERVNTALAELEHARALWLPSLFLGPTLYRADGHVQTITGQVVNVNRRSLFVGGLAASPIAAGPSTGPPISTPCACRHAWPRTSSRLTRPVPRRRRRWFTRRNR
jgi:outer membrane protein TolC